METVCGTPVEGITGVLGVFSSGVTISEDPEVSNLEEVNLIVFVSEDNVGVAVSASEKEGTDVASAGTEADVAGADVAGAETDEAGADVAGAETDVAGAGARADVAMAGADVARAAEQI